MAEIARFAESPSGRLHAAACERYSVDPAKGITSDPIEAMNLRAALMITSIPETEPEDEPSPFDKARAATAAAFPDG